MGLNPFKRKDTTENEQDTPDEKPAITLETLSARIDELEEELRHYQAIPRK